MMYEAKKYLDDSIAEDAASESFIKVIQNLDKFQDITSNQTRAYVVTIVRNISINILKKNKRIAPSPDEVFEVIHDSNADILSELTAKDGVVAIRNAIELLPQNMKDVLLLHIGGDSNHADIAKMLGISEAASKKRLERARNEIKKRLAGERNGEKY